MDFVCNFGRSVDVDGDEWIDLGLPSAPLEMEEPVQVNTRHEVKLRDGNNTGVTAKVQTTAISERPAIPEPNTEPEPEQPDTDTKTRELQKKSAKVTESHKPQLGASSPMIKAAKSKEALMAFYLGRAKQMEAKHKTIVVSKPPHSERSLPIGL